MATEKDWVKIHEQAAVKYKYVRETAGDAPIPPPPQVPPNVTEVGLPAKSDSVDWDGVTLDYIPLAQYCNQSKCEWTITSIGYPIIGIMTTDGNVVYPKYTVNGSQGSLLDILMIDPKSDLGIGTVIRQTLYWGRVTQDWIPANTPHSTSKGITSGITEEQSESLSFTVGAKVGFNNPSGIVGELSAGLTKSFSSSVSITQQTTVTENFEFPEKKVPQVDGVYQLMQTFSIYPGANLANYVANMNEGYLQSCQQFHMFCMICKAEMPFTYPTPSYLQIAGTDSEGVRVTKHMLSPDEITALVKSSVKME